MKQREMLPMLLMHSMCIILLAGCGTTAVHMDTATGMNVETAAAAVQKSETMTKQKKYHRDICGNGTGCSGWRRLLCAT